MFRAIRRAIGLSLFVTAALTSCPIAPAASAQSVAVPATNPAATQAQDRPIDVAAGPAVAPAAAAGAASAPPGSPFKQVTVPEATVTDVTFDNDGWIIVASGTALYIYNPAGLYNSKSELGETVRGLSSGGGSIFALLDSGAVRYDRNFTEVARYADVARLSDQPVAGSDWLVYVDRSGRFARTSLTTGVTQSWAAPSGTTAVSIWAVVGANQAAAATNSTLVTYDLSGTGAPASAGSGSVPLEGGTLLGTQPGAAAALVVKGDGLHRVSLSGSSSIGTATATGYAGTTAVATVAANGGWETFLSGGGAALRFFGPTQVDGSASPPATAIAWNVQGTQLAAVSPSNPKAILSLYAAPGDPRPATEFSGSGGEYTAITPTRVLDTRSGVGATPGPLGPGRHVDVQVSGIGAIPSTNVLAVAVNLTAISPTEPTYLTGYPTGANEAPFVSNVNAGPGEIRPNLAIVRVGQGGRISILNAAGATEVAADVQGYFTTSAGAAGGRYHPVTPTRLLDTRDSGPFQPDGGYALAVRGRGGVPAGASAVALTVTAVAPTQPTYVTAYPNGAARPEASNLNAPAQQTVANLVFAGIGGDGHVALYNAAGDTHVVVDVVGYWDGDRSTEAGRFIPFTAPFRYYDSREDTGLGPIRAGYRRSLQVAGWPGADPVIPLPYDGASAVVYNATATNTTAGGFLTAYPGGEDTAPPLASNMNFSAGQTAASLAITGYGVDGRISFFNPAGTLDLIADMSGFFTSTSF